jgi:hypothetical protein
LCSDAKETTKGLMQGSPEGPTMIKVVGAQKDKRLGYITSIMKDKN